MKPTHPMRSTSAFAGLVAAFVSSGLWLSFGLFVVTLQGGGEA